MRSIILETLAVLPRLAKRSVRVVASALVFVVLIGTVVVWDADTAGACSCIQPAEVGSVSEAAAAFIGVATDVVGDPISEPGERRVAVRFEVLEPIKGVMGDSVTVYVKAQEDSCGKPRFLPGDSSPRFGEPSAVVLWNAGNLIVAEDCTSLEPDYIRHAETGLPPPSASDPVVAVGLGELMGTSIQLLNASGEPVAYAESTGVVDEGVVCSDGVTAVQVALDDGRAVIQWRDLPTLSVAARQPVDRNAKLVSCVQAGRVLLRVDNGFRVVDPGGATTAILASHNNRPAVSGDGSHVAWIDADESIVVRSVDSAVERSQVSGAAPGELYGVALNHDGSKLAVVSYTTRPHLTVVDSSGQNIQDIDVAGTDAGGGIWWVDDDVVAVNTGDLRVVGLDETSTLSVEYVSGQTIAVLGARVLTRDGSGVYKVTDLTTGEEHDLGTGPLNHGFPLAEPIDFAGSTYSQDPPLQLPIPGATLPATADELVEFFTSAPTATTDEAVPTPAPQATPVPSASAPDDARSDATSQRFRLVLLTASLVVAAGAIVLIGRRRFSRTGSN